MRNFSERLLEKIMKLEEERSQLYKTIDKLIDEKNKIADQEMKARSEISLF